MVLHELESETEMQMNNYAFLSLVSVVLIVGFHLVALFYVLTRPADGSSAKKLAVASLLITLLLPVVGLIFHSVVNFFSVENIMLYLGLFSIFSTLLGLVATGLLLAAAFHDRSPSVSLNLPAGRKLNDKNPYSVG
jgi:protein-S-isoprenylcysteine O-methyltransferase Ste14